MSESFPLGSLIRISVVFTNENDIEVDPTGVTFRLLTPSGVSTDYIYGVDPLVVRDAAGRYHADVDANDEGKWTYRFAGTGAVQAADESNFRIRESAFV